MIVWLHHLACTGGTLFARLLASQPNIILLNEVSPAGKADGATFRPLAPMDQFLARYPEFDSHELRLDFLAGQITTIAARAKEAGKILFIRDHSHSDFMQHLAQPEPLMPQLKGRIEGEQTHIVTVRHPAASYTSLVNNKWNSAVVDYEDYCQRYRAFLDCYTGAAVYRYERLASKPVETFTNLLSSLKLSPDVRALNDYRSQTLSGDSGRGAGQAIHPLPFSSWSEAFAEWASRGEHHRALCAMLHYEPSIMKHVFNTNYQALCADPTLVEHAQIARRALAVDTAKPADGRATVKERPSARVDDPRAADGKKSETVSAQGAAKSEPVKPKRRKANPGRPS